MIADLLAIDPGVIGTGWAVFNKEHKLLIAHGTVRPLNKSKDWLDRAIEVTERLFTATVEEYPIENIYIECPRFMGGTAGLMVASRGDLVKLCLLTGMILCTVTQNISPTIALPEPSEWKGQLPKEVCQERIEKILKRSFKGDSNHAVDAIGIGLWALGRF